MTVYVLIYITLLLLALADVFITKSTRKIVIIPMAVLFFVIVMLAGLRWETGTDWTSYIRFFNNIDNVPLWRSTMEIGYEFLVRSFKLIFGPNYTLWLFFIATFILSFTYVTIYKISPYPLFSLFLLFSYSLVGSGFGVRQDLSICITIYSVAFIIERAPIKFLVTVFIASLLHNSAFIFLPAYFVFNFKWNVLRSILVIAFVGICLIMSEQLMQTFGYLVAEGKTERYMDMGFQELTGEDPYLVVAKGIAARSLVVLICIWYVNYQSEENALFNGIFNLYIFGIVIYAIFTPMNLVFSRMARPYEVFQIFLFPAMYPLAKRAQKPIIISIVFAFYIAKFLSQLKASDGVFIPYQSVLK